MDTQFIITEKRGNVTLDIVTQNGDPGKYNTEKFKKILLVLEAACKAIKEIELSELAPK